MTRYAIVTGANTPSIGFRMAQMLAGAPHRFHVVLACRSRTRGLEAHEKILAADPESRATFIECDLADLESVRTFAGKYRALDAGQPQTTGLSLLLCNAGVGFGRDVDRRFTEQQFEEKIGINHLGHFLLTNLLLPDLQRSRAARVVVVSSSLHDPKSAGGQRGGRPCTLDLDDLQLAKEGAFDSAFAYKRSKLANLLFAYELKRRLAASGCNTVHVSACCPGFIPSTNLGRDAGIVGQFFLQWILDGVLKWIGLVNFTRTIDEGAAVAVLCATSDVCADGGYHRLTKEGALELIQSSEESYDEAKAKKLWQMSTRLTESHGSVADLHSLSPPRGGGADLI
jgi:NAD(P)-dependent dehydrogenase (short-subunit alcohol dehydrogenase family)